MIPSSRRRRLAGVPDSLAEDFSRPHGHFAGRHVAKSRPRCGAAGFASCADFRALPISNERLRQTAPQSGRILLDPACRNAYKVASKKEGQVRADFRGQIADPRIEAHRRGWMIHPRDAAVRDQGPFEALFYFPEATQWRSEAGRSTTVEQVR